VSTGTKLQNTNESNISSKKAVSRKRTAEETFVKTEKTDDDDDDVPVKKMVASRFRSARASAKAEATDDEEYVPLKKAVAKKQKLRKRDHIKVDNESFSEPAANKHQSSNDIGDVFTIKATQGETTPTQKEGLDHKATTQDIPNVSRQVQAVRRSARIRKSTGSQAGLYPDASPGLVVGVEQDHDVQKDLKGIPESTIKAEAQTYAETAPTIQPGVIDTEEQDIENPEDVANKRRKAPVKKKAVTRKRKTKKE
jgi:hypothetical protein